MYKVGGHFSREIYSERHLGGNRNSPRFWVTLLQKVHDKHGSCLSVNHNPRRGSDKNNTPFW